MTPVVPVLVFFDVLLLALAYTWIGRSSPPAARNQPLFLTSEPNRRNQSHPSGWARGAGYVVDVGGETQSPECHPEQEPEPGHRAVAL